MEGNNWRNQRHPVLRNIALNTIMDALRQLVPSLKEQDLLQIKTLAMNFEEKTYSTAKNQEEYLKIISMKMHKIVSNSSGSDSSCTADILPHSASHNMHSKTNVQQPPVTVQSDSLPSVRPLISGSAHTLVPDVSAESPTQHKISSVLHSSVGNCMAHRASSKTSVGHQRQLLQNQQQGLACQNRGYQQSQPQILKQFKMESVSGSFQTHTEQEGQNQKDQKQLQPFQQHVCYQPQHAHPIHHNLLPLQKQPQFMGQRLSTVDVQQGQHSHPQPWEKHLFSHSKPANLQQAPIPSQQDMQHRLHTSAIDFHSPTKEHASVEIDEKEALARVEQMKKKYLPALDALQKMVSAELQSRESLSPQPNPGHVKQLKGIEFKLVNIASFLKNPQNKNNVYERLDLAEETIINVMKQARQHTSPSGQHHLNAHSMHQTLRPPSHAQIVVEPRPITSSTRLLPDGSTSLLEWHMLESNPIVLQNMHQNVQMVKPRQEIDEQQVHRPLTQQRRQVVQQQQMNEVRNVKLSSGASVKVSQNQAKETKSKIIQGRGVKPEALQQHQSAGQCSSRPHHLSQAKAGSALHNRNSPSIPCIVPKSTLPPPHELRSSKEVICDVSTSPLLAASNNLDDTQCDASTSISDESNVAEQPFERLLKVVKSMSAKALRASVSDIESIVSMTDMMTEVPIPLGGSRGVIGEDLCAMTKCRLQASCFSHMDDALGTRKRKRGTSQMPLDIAALAGGINGCFDMDKSRLDSSATSKWSRVETKLSLLEEIRKVNQRLIDTVVDISDGDADKITCEYDEGTIVTCSFNAVSVNPNFLMSSTLSLWLLVPINYPNCSPALLDNLPPKLSEEEDLSEKAKARLKRSLESLEHPFSVGKVARTWDCCARQVVLEQAMQYGGGTFTSKYGGWDNCLTAA